jgi:predicted nucleic acid-binding protein
MAKKIYLETTIFNFPFADDAPQYQDDTRKLFKEIKAGKFEAYTSEYVIRELRDTRETEKREKMFSLIQEYSVRYLEATPEIDRLGRVYIGEGVIPVAYEADALHIAAATIHSIDIIVSLNFKHIVKHKTIIETEIINAREGYKRVFIHTPAEVIENENN